MTPIADCTLVAIARDERRYILEWLAYHLGRGFGAILVYDNASSDGTRELLHDVASREPRIRVVDWPSVDGRSPQRSAYNHALSIAATEWLAFADIDEFIVPLTDDGIAGFLDRVPPDVSAVCMNWKGFGSSNVADDSYELVIETFTRCAPQDWTNNYHIKTIARRSLIQNVFIHYVETTSGRHVMSDLTTPMAPHESVAAGVVHGRIQVNHYQCKTFAEFVRRMERGDANYPDTHPDKQRDKSRARYDLFDRNEEQDLAILRFVPATRATMAALAGDGQAAGPASVPDGRSRSGPTG